MLRQYKYRIKIEALASKNLRKNVSAYYLMLINQKQSKKMYSKPLLIDRQNDDEITVNNDVDFNKVQLWDYDKITMLEQRHLVFTMCDTFTFTCEQEEVVYSVSKSQEMKSNKNLGSSLVNQNLSMVSPFGDHSINNNNQQGKNCAGQLSGELEKSNKNNRKSTKKLTIDDYGNDDDSVCSIRIKEKKSPPSNKKDNISERVSRLLNQFAA